jgi:hypothetical protein
LRVMLRAIGGQSLFTAFKVVAALWSTQFLIGDRALLPDKVRAAIFEGWRV